MAHLLPSPAGRPSCCSRRPSYALLLPPAATRSGCSRSRRPPLSRAAHLLPLPPAAARSGCSRSPAPAGRRSHSLGLLRQPSVAPALVLLPPAAARAGAAPESRRLLAPAAACPLVPALLLPAALLCSCRLRLCLRCSRQPTLVPGTWVGFGWLGNRDWGGELGIKGGEEPRGGRGQSC